MKSNKLSVDGKNKLLENFYFKLCAAGIIMFVCALLYAPASGVLRTIPFFVAGGVACELLSVSMGVSAAFCALMTLSVYLASGRSVGEALVYAAVSELLLVAGIYVVKLIRIFKKNTNKSVRKKCAVLGAFALIVAIAVSVVMCGNIVSFIANDSANTEYIVKYYGEEVEKRYTSYEAFDGGYTTYVAFRDGDSAYGNDDDCFVRKEGKSYVDGVRDHYESEMLAYAENELAEIISRATYGFNVVVSGINFSEGEILDSKSDVNDYLDRVSYVVSFDSIINQDEKHKFVPICYDVVTALGEKNFAFKEIVLCAGNVDEVIYSLTVTPGMASSDVKGSVGKFDEKQIRKHGVTEEDVLDYWMNR